MNPILVNSVSFLGWDKDAEFRWPLASCVSGLTQARKQNRYTLLGYMGKDKQVGLQSCE